MSESARHAAANRTALTFVWLDGNQVVGFYALAAHEIQREAIRNKIGKGSPDRIPAVLLAKLALDSRLHARHLGGSLLVDALERILVAAGNVGARFVVVDAIDDEGARFYEHFGFVRTESGGLRLVRKVSDIVKSFGSDSKSGRGAEASK